jgi:hypothetical protein
MTSGGHRAERGLMCGGFRMRWWLLGHDFKTFRNCYMREEILRRFFQGEATASELAKDVAGSTKKVSKLISRVGIEDMDTCFTVTRPMLISLCDAVLGRVLPAEELRTIGFALQASDKFEWDGDEDELVAEVIADWSCPEINYPLTLENIVQFRNWLIEAEPYPSKPNQNVEFDGRLISITEKKSIERFWRRRKKT